MSESKQELRDKIIKLTQVRITGEDVEDLLNRIRAAEKAMADLRNFAVRLRTKEVKEPSVDRLKATVQRLHNILSDDKRGHGTWWVAVAEALTEIMKEAGYNNVEITAK